MYKFNVEKINNNTFAFFDENEDTFYLLNEKNVSILIDTGMQKNQNISPTLSMYTNNPIILLVTHAHEDHLYHMNEFDKVYLSHKEFVLKNLSIDLIHGGKQSINIEKTIDIYNREILLFGEETIQICEVPGHTPGSVVFYAKKRNILFTGDALGSGCGMWLQLPGVLSLEEYSVGLHNLLDFTSDMSKDVLIFGGHQHQVYQSRLIKGYNPLTISYIRDLSIMTDKIIDGEITKFLDEGPYEYLPGVRRLYCSYNKAELQFRSDKIYKERNFKE